MVKKKIENPQYLAVSANIVGNFGLTWIHNHLGAVHSYLPDTASPSLKTVDWQVSGLPQWSGTDDWRFESFESVSGHRWLPLSARQSPLPKMPIDAVEYSGIGRSEWNSWKLAAQLHYSFLQNLEKEELWRYDFGTWNLMYQRLGINMFAISGEDVVRIGNMPADDEKFLTMEYSREVDRPFVVDGRGLAVHHGHMWMTKQSDTDLRLEGTDVLQRYRLYAADMICGT